MKLYYTPDACSLAALVVLEWTGAPYEAVRVERSQWRSPEFLAVNPSGAVPAFEEDGWVLTQNAAILGYLAERFPQAALHGDTPHARAETQRWLAFVNSDVHPTFRPLLGALRFLDAETDRAAVEKTQQAARERLRGQFEIVDRRLDGRDWITGRRSIADPYLFVVLRWAHRLELDLSGLAQLQRFFERMQDDAGVQGALRAQGGGA